MNKQRLQAHPLAELFPVMERKDFALLVESIHKNGLRDPIVIYEGKILDGRHRFDACMELGIEPQITEFFGHDARQFVFDRNLVRRQLSRKQKRALIKRMLETNSHLSNREIAQLARVDDHTVAAVRNGSVPTAEIPHLERPEERVRRALIADPGLSVSQIVELAKVGRATASRLRKRLIAAGTIPRITNKSPKDRARSGAKIALNNGHSSIIDAVNAGIAVESAGGGGASAVTTSGLATQSYKCARDIILLSSRDDLSKSEAAAVLNALTILKEKQQVREAYALVRPIVQKVWGAKGNRFKSDKKRLEAFHSSLSYIATVCESAAEIVIPHISEQERNKALSELDGARRSLGLLIARIQKGTSNG